MSAIIYMYIYICFVLFSLIINLNFWFSPACFHIYLILCCEMWYIYIFFLVCLFWIFFAHIQFHSVMCAVCQVYACMWGYNELWKYILNWLCTISRCENWKLKNVKMNVFDDRVLESVCSIVRLLKVQWYVMWMRAVNV